MEWTDIRLTVAKADAENAEAVATLIAEGGIYIEDYSDIEQQCDRPVGCVGCGWRGHHRAGGAACH